MDTSIVCESWVPLVIEQSSFFLRSRRSTGSVQVQYHLGRIEGRINCQNTVVEVRFRSMMADSHTDADEWGRQMRAIVTKCRTACVGIWQHREGGQRRGNYFSLTAFTLLPFGCSSGMAA
jgi:hypothetical protein